jgi:hypothetical protein
MFQVLSVLRFQLGFTPGAGACLASQQVVARPAQKNTMLNRGLRRECRSCTEIVNHRLTGFEADNGWQTHAMLQCCAGVVFQRYLSDCWVKLTVKVKALLQQTCLAHLRNQCHLHFPDMRPTAPPSVCRSLSFRCFPPPSCMARWFSHVFASPNLQYLVRKHITSVLGFQFSEQTLKIRQWHFNV